MKANELMIGDWVLAYGKETQIVWVGNIHKMAVRGFPYEFMDGEIEPIPLTPEILEKNGWVKDLYSAESYDNEELECLSLWVGEDGKNKWWWHAGCELVTPINYVHQLQHALRLCGIEKEIQL